MVSVFAHRLGTGLAVVAVCAQLMLGMLVPRQATPSLAALLPWVTAICHADRASGGGPARHPHTLPGWAVCPFTLALSVPLAHPASAAVPPRPAALWVAWRPMLPQARAPPVRTQRAAQPRGPPALI